MAARIGLCATATGKEKHEKRTNGLAERFLVPALVMTAASAALLRFFGQRGCSPGGCDATHLALVGPLGGLPRLRALPRLDPQNRTPDRQNYPRRQYGAGSFAVGLEASFLRRSKGYRREACYGQESRRVQPAGVNVLRQGERVSFPKQHRLHGSRREQRRFGAG